MRLTSTIAVLAVLSFGCGSAVQVTRTGRYLPPREGQCSLEVLNAHLADVQADYEVVGMIGVGNGEDDPFGEDAREEIFPAACAMGGEAIVLMMHAQSPGTYNSTGYAVLVRRERGGQSSAQQPPPSAAVTSL